MTRLTVNISNDNDASFLKEVLDRFGLNYEIETVDNEYLFSKDEIEGFVKTKQDFLDGKTTGRPWAEVKEELNRVFNHNS